MLGRNLLAGEASAVVLRSKSSCLSQTMEEPKLETTALLLESAASWLYGEGGFFLVRGVASVVFFAEFFANQRFRSLTLCACSAVPVASQSAQAAESV